MNTDTQARIVHVVAWEFDGGGGMWWYPDEADAQNAYRDELRNCAEFKENQWKATIFSARIPSSWKRDTVTTEIDQWLWQSGLPVVGSIIDFRK